MQSKQNTLLQAIFPASVIEFVSIAFPYRLYYALSAEKANTGFLQFHKGQQKLIHKELL